MDFISVRETAEKWGISERSVQHLAQKGRIKGVSRFGNSWMIPKDAHKPADPRIARRERGEPYHTGKKRMTGKSMADENAVTDMELYRRFLDGDETAYERLVTLHRSSLTRYINTFLKDARDAEELMIDAFAELATHKKYKGRSALKTYLFSIGRNLAFQHIKKYGSYDNVSVRDITETYEAEDGLLEMDFIREEQRAEVRTAMNTLKSEHREILYLVYFEDMSYADAGVAMRKTVSQITSLLHRAKASLKDKLDNKGAGV